MHRLLYILCLFAFLGASAQRMPERSQVRQGNRHYHKGDYKPAIERYTQALSYAPESSEALYDLGNALYKAELFDKAEQTMARAAADTLRSDTERAEAFYNLGNAQFKQQKYKEALESYRRAMLLDPADMEAKYNYAYTKKLIEDNQDRNQDQNGGDRNQDRNQDPQNDEGQQNGDGASQDRQQDPAQNDEQQGDGQDGRQDESQDDGRDDGKSVPAGISEQEQQQMLDAIQAQEDKTQDKLKEKQGVVVRGKKNW